jgi:hypothetical protein
MTALKNMGIICINGEIQGDCQNCLWLEWDRGQKQCQNHNTRVCPLSKENRTRNATAKVSSQLMYL